MTDTWVQPLILRGERLVLEPLGDQHAPALARHFHPDLFRYLRVGGPRLGTVQEYEEYIAALNAEPRRVNFAITHGGEAVGRTSYVNIDEAAREVEIGTMIVREWQGTFVNPESKLLMMRHAFETLRATQVNFKVDETNERSRRAMVRLGAAEVGVLHGHVIMSDGRVRNSVVYAVTHHAWPEVQEGLRARLAGTPGAPS